MLSKAVAWASVFMVCGVFICMQSKAAMALGSAKVGDPNCIKSVIGFP